MLEVATRRRVSAGERVGGRAGGDRGRRMALGTACPAAAAGPPWGERTGASSAAKHLAGNTIGGCHKR